MLIQVLTQESASTKEKGALLEDLATKFLETQGYSVSKGIRITASELDLLCKHNVNSKEIYVECKAHRDNLSANVLKNLLGTINFNDYAEGWLISTGELGKDAKGFVDTWEKKEPIKKEKLSIYTPERIMQALLSARIISEKPQSLAMELIKDSSFTLGEWTLIVTQWGKYWTCPVLLNGVPKSVVIYCAEKSVQVSDTELFEKLKTTEFLFGDLEFIKNNKLNLSNQQNNRKNNTAVVQVEYGEMWFDYRPARPEHFVGRKEAQKELLRLFSDIKKKRSSSRVFAIKGDSGIGKSSLVAKMRDVTKSSQKPNKLFLYAVDMRAANDASYIYSSLIAALNEAANQGFGSSGKLEVSNCSDPLQSESIKEFIEECNKKHELIILVLDQFEELYSKPELFPVFEEAKRLMFSAISAASNLALGFAWKADSTVPQDHPAYHMWHQLADHRFEVALKQFSHTDAEQSLSLFENEIGEKLLQELRKYLLENSRGYPWLLKKLCIHFNEQLQKGMNQHQLANSSLDISSLFDQDLSNLTDAETGCLKLVAKNAPMDWYEVLESAGHTVVQSLQDRRLLIRRGDKLNLYWDIFRDYVLSGNVPSIPFNYIPQSPSLDALIRISQELDDVEGKTLQELAGLSKLQESTMRNIVHDLDQFGIIAIEDNKITINGHLSDIESKTILYNIRLLFKRHALTDLLKKYNSIKSATNENIVTYLKIINPTAQHHIRTWTTYAKRLSIWLHALGLIHRTTEGIVYKDLGDIVEENVRKGAYKRRNIVFLGDASPAKAVQALEILKKKKKSQVSMKNMGFRNACAVLLRFRLIELSSTNEYNVSESIQDSLRAVWHEAKKESSLLFVIDHLNKYPSTSAEKIGQLVANNFERQWEITSCRRVGNGLRQWATWLMPPLVGNSEIPAPPGRISQAMTNQLSLFSNIKK